MAKDLNQNVVNWYGNSRKDENLKLVMKAEPGLTSNETTDVFQDLLKI